MMDLYLIYIGISFGIIFLLVVAVVMQAKKVGQARQIAEENLQQMKLLQNELKALYTAAAGMGGRLARIENRLNDVSDRQEVLEVKDPTIHHYNEAIEMVHEGADVEQLMRRCGLLQEEAELLVRLHGPQAVE